MIFIADVIFISEDIVLQESFYQLWRKPTELSNARAWRDLVLCIYLALGMSHIDNPHIVLINMKDMYYTIITPKPLHGIYI